MDQTTGISRIHEGTLAHGKENPWYVLMTIFGESKGPREDRSVVAKNAYFWNGWVNSIAEYEQYKQRLGGISLPDLTREELALIRSTLLERSGINLEEMASLEGISFENTVLEKPLHVQGFVFPKVFCAKDAIFKSGISVRGSRFIEAADFSGAEFYTYADFPDVAFFEGCSFTGASFDSYLKFRRCQSFGGWVSFERAQIREGCDFEGSVFDGYARFEYCEFHGVAAFVNVKFGRKESGIVPSGVAYFRFAVFHDFVSFRGSEFQDLVSFEQAKLLSGVDFDSAKFTGERAAPPAFFGAEIIGSASWIETQWPKLPKDKRTAHTHRRAYERLKNIMSEGNSYPEEHMFLRLSLQSREVEEGVCAVSLGSKFYRLFSDYGWSINRPLAALFAVWILGGFGIFLFESQQSLAFGIGTSLGLSASNLFSFLGLGSNVFLEELSSLTASSEIIVGIQALCGPVLLFFLLLAFRNRMKVS